MRMRSYLCPLHTFHVPFREAMSSLWGSEVWLVLLGETLGQACLALYGRL